MTMRICVKYSEYCDHSERASERYGSWSESWSSSVDEAYVLNENENGPYSSDTFLVPDDTTTVHVVYMIYDTGDSFGRATGKIDIMHCTSNEDAAHKLADMVTKNKDEYSLKFTDDFGREISISNSGAGYFESISYVGVESFTVGKGRRNKYYVN